MSFNATKKIDAAWDITPVRKNSHANVAFYFRQEVTEQARWQIATLPQLLRDPVAAF